MDTPHTRNISVPSHEKMTGATHGVICLTSAKLPALEKWWSEMTNMILRASILRVLKLYALLRNDGLSFKASNDSRSKSFSNSSTDNGKSFNNRFWSFIVYTHFHCDTKRTEAQKNVTPGHPICSVTWWEESSGLHGFSIRILRECLCRRKVARDVIGGASSHAQNVEWKIEEGESSFQKCSKAVTLKTTSNVFVIVF